MFIQVEGEFDAAHRLWRHEGKCNNVHGHRWVVTCLIEGKDLTTGMVADFSKVKKWLKKYFEEFDHCILISSEALEANDPCELDLYNFVIKNEMKRSILPMDSTAENLARYFFEGLNRYFVDTLSVAQVAVAESPGNVAIYGVPKPENIYFNIGTANISLPKEVTE